MTDGSTLVRELWEKFEARDFPSAAELLREDFVCHLAPSHVNASGGGDNFIAVNAHYPRRLAHPHRTDYR